MTPTIELSHSEIIHAVFGGAMRQIENIIDPARRRQDKHGAEHVDGWGAHIDGALGELAFAKSRGAYWAGVGLFRGPDLEFVGGQTRIQIRTSPSHAGSLIVRTTDDDGDAFVLVTGRIPTFRIRGWLYGYEAKKPIHWTDKNTGRPPAWFVPADQLRSIESLELAGMVQS